MARRLLVTGANGGIGLATTIAAHRAGWDVVAAVRNEDNFYSVTKRVPGVTVTTLDVADAHRCEEVIAEFEPTAIVNNAGFGTAKAIEEVSDEDARYQLEVMAIAPMRIARLALPHMRANNGGRVVNVSSLGGRTACALTGWYTASKHALEAATDALRMEIARDGIKVVLIEPGGVATGILEKASASLNTESSRYERSYRRAEQLTRLSQRFQGNPDRVAATIVRALESRNPRPRYVVGLDARAMLLAGKFPVRARDQFKRTVLKL